METRHQKRMDRMQRQWQRFEPWMIVAGPAVILISFVALLAVQQTRWLAERLLSENWPVELLTFVLLIWAAICGFMIAIKASKHGEHKLVIAFYALFAVLSFVVAMEEIAWGQQFFPIETPEFFKKFNVQGELTLHNLQGHNSATGLFVFGVAGLIGHSLSLLPSFKKITPPLVMLPWFLLIAIAGGIDRFTDQTATDEVHIYVIAWLGEVVEMMIAMASVIFLWLKRRELAETWRAAVKDG